MVIIAVIDLVLLMTMMPHFHVSCYWTDSTQTSWRRMDL